jgi:transcriptional regulator
MYIPNHFREDDRDKLLAFMRANSFAILVTHPSTLRQVPDPQSSFLGQRNEDLGTQGSGSGAPFATHLPLVVEADESKVMLKGHVAKANPQWQGFETPLPTGEGMGVGHAVNEALVIFHGPHAYISPAHYESRQSVPTWNYIAVHAYGVPRIVETKEAMLDAMIAQYEPAHLEQWHGQSEKYKAGMLAGIVAFEIDVTRLEGKYKLSQNRPEGDRQRVIASLGESDDPTISGIAAHMR